MDIEIPPELNHKFSPQHMERLRELASTLPPGDQVLLFETVAKFDAGQLTMAFDLTQTFAAERFTAAFELVEKLPAKSLLLLYDRDGPAKFAEHLPSIFKPNEVAEQSNAQRAWELVGLYYLNQKRLYEALSIFSLLYDQILLTQETEGNWYHKGMPLCWISDCYLYMGFRIHAKRYIMLTLCEDAIRWKGNIPIETTGVYFRLIWRYGLSDSEFKRYSKLAFELYQEYPSEAVFPEWILQRLDTRWMTDFPDPKEVSMYTINSRYVNNLISKPRDMTGKTWEKLAEYLLSCMPGWRTNWRKRSGSSDYDIICSIDGFDVDFRSEFGRVFVCECKDTVMPADYTTIAKFCRVLDSIKSRFGIVFSRWGISGQGKTLYGEREQLKVFQDRGMVIVVVDEDDLRRVANGENFINLLRTKYERVRLDLRESANRRKKRAAKESKQG